jgi:hypothetical protein
VICFTAVPKRVRLSVASNHIASEVTETSYILYAFFLGDSPVSVV